MKKPDNSETTKQVSSDTSTENPLTEKERKRQLDEWSNTPSPNPFYRGKTPLEVAQILLKSSKNQ